MTTEQFAENNITLEDIKKAIDLINERKQPLTRIDLGEGWIEIDARGNPINIGFTEKGMEAIKQITQFQRQLVDLEDGIEIATIYGIPIVKSREVKS